jgi:hypothetical protein
MSDLQYIGLLAALGVATYVVAKMIELANKEQMAVLRQIAAALEARNSTKSG